MGTFLVLEVGGSAYTEFKMKTGKFQRTDDAVLLGAVEAQNMQDAINIAKELNHCKNRDFEALIAYEVKKG